jgi:hypothetical protein
MEEVLEGGVFKWYGRDRRKQNNVSGEGGVGLLIRKSLG